VVVLTELLPLPLPCTVAREITVDPVVRPLALVRAEVVRATALMTVLPVVLVIVDPSVVMTVVKAEVVSAPPAAPELLAVALLLPLGVVVADPEPVALAVDKTVSAEPDRVV